MPVKIELFAQQVGDHVPGFFLSEAFSAKAIRDARLGACLPLVSVCVSLNSKKATALILSSKEPVRHLEQGAWNSGTAQHESVRRIEARQALVHAPANAEQSAQLPSESELADASSAVVVQAEMRRETARGWGHRDVEPVRGRPGRERSSEVLAQ